jgi:hypothetical protein
MASQLLFEHWLLRSNLTGRRYVWVFLESMFVAVIHLYLNSKPGRQATDLERLLLDGHAPAATAISWH